MSAVEKVIHYFEHTAHEDRMKAGSVKCVSIRGNSAIFTGTRDGADDRVCMKVFLCTVHDVQPSKLCKRELMCMYSLCNHPNIVQPLSEGNFPHPTGTEESLDGRAYYFVMPWLQPLSKADASLPFMERLRFGLQHLRSLLSALAFMHAHGRSHGDVAIDNVMTAENGLMLIDFGSSQKHEDGAVSAMRRDGGGKALYKPPYVDDYQQRMLDDVYAAVLVFFELVTGSRPYTNVLRKWKPEDPPQIHQLQPLWDAGKLPFDLSIPSENENPLWTQVTEKLIPLIDPQTFPNRHSGATLPALHLFDAKQLEGSVQRWLRTCDRSDSQQRLASLHRQEDLVGLRQDAPQAGVLDEAFESSLVSLLQTLLQLQRLYHDEHKVLRCLDSEDFGCRDGFSQSSLREAVELPNNACVVECNRAPGAALSRFEPFRIVYDPHSDPSGDAGAQYLRLQSSVYSAILHFVHRVTGVVPYATLPDSIFVNRQVEALASEQPYAVGTLDRCGKSLNGLIEFIFFALDPDNFLRLTHRNVISRITCMAQECQLHDANLVKAIADATTSLASEHSQRRSEAVENETSDTHHGSNSTGALETLLPDRLRRMGLACQVQQLLEPCGDVAQAVVSIRQIKDKDAEITDTSTTTGEGWTVRTARLYPKQDCVVLEQQYAQTCKSTKGRALFEYSPQKVSDLAGFCLVSAFHMSLAVEGGMEAKILPVVKRIIHILKTQLIPLHAQDRCHGDICFHRVLSDKSRTSVVLLPSWRRDFIESEKPPPQCVRYCTPSALRGELSKHNDVYALVLVLMHAVTGQPPYKWCASSAKVARKCILAGNSPYDEDELMRWRDSPLCDRFFSCTSDLLLDPGDLDAEHVVHKLAALVNTPHPNRGPLRIGDTDHTMSVIFPFETGQLVIEQQLKVLNVGRSGRRVFWATTAEQPKRDVAIKVFTEARKTAYDNEVRMMSLPRHQTGDGIQKLEAHGEFNVSASVADGIKKNYYHITEKLEKLHPPNDCFAALHLFGQLVEALVVVHAERISHGDVSPSNLMKRSNGQLVLIDFELARQHNPQGDAVQRSGMTLLYLPYESLHWGLQYMQDDLYAAAVVCVGWIVKERPYERLFGRHAKVSQADLEAAMSRGDKPFNYDRVIEVLREELGNWAIAKDVCACLEQWTDPTTANTFAAEYLRSKCLGWVRRLPALQVAVERPLFGSFRERPRSDAGSDRRAAHVSRQPSVMSGGVSVPGSVLSAASRAPTDHHPVESTEPFTLPLHIVLWTTFLAAVLAFVIGFLYVIAHTTPSRAFDPIDPSNIDFVKQHFPVVFDELRPTLDGMGERWFVRFVGVGAGASLSIWNPASPQYACIKAACDYILHRVQQQNASTKVLSYFTMDSYEQSRFRSDLFNDTTVLVLTNVTSDFVDRLYLRTHMSQNDNCTADDGKPNIVARWLPVGSEQQPLELRWQHRRLWNLVPAILACVGIGWMLRRKRMILCALNAFVIVATMTAVWGVLHRLQINVPIGWLAGVHGLWIAVFVTLPLTMIDSFRCHLTSVYGVSRDRFLRPQLFIFVYCVIEMWAYALVMNVACSAHLLIGTTWMAAFASLTSLGFAMALNVFLPLAHICKWMSRPHLISEVAEADSKRARLALTCKNFVSGVSTLRFTVPRSDERKRRGVTFTVNVLVVIVSLTLLGTWFGWVRTTCHQTVGQHDMYHGTLYNNHELVDEEFGSYWAPYFLTVCAPPGHTVEEPEFVTTLIETLAEAKSPTEEDVRIQSYLFFGGVFIANNASIQQLVQSNASYRYLFDLTVTPSRRCTTIDVRTREDPFLGGRLGTRVLRRFHRIAHNNRHPEVIDSIFYGGPQSRMINVLAQWDTARPWVHYGIWVLTLLFGCVHHIFVVVPPSERHWALFHQGGRILQSWIAVGAFLCPPYMSLLTVYGLLDTEHGQFFFLEAAYVVPLLVQSTFLGMHTWFALLRTIMNEHKTRADINTIVDETVQVLRYTFLTTLRCVAVSAVTMIAIACSCHPTKFTTASVLVVVFNGVFVLAVHSFVIPALLRTHVFRRQALNLSPARPDQKPLIQRDPSAVVSFTRALPVQ